MNRKTLHRWAPFIAAALILLLWQAVCALFAIPDFIFPSPWTIAQATAASIICASTRPSDCRRWLFYKMT